jgi:hypothetical protein
MSLTQQLRCISNRKGKLAGDGMTIGSTGAAGRVVSEITVNWLQPDYPWRHVLAERMSLSCRYTKDLYAS